MTDCCQTKDNYQKGFLSGLLYGLIPHSFCIAFLILSIIGAAGATIFVKKFLLIPHFLLFLVILSFLFASISAIIYLKKTDSFSLMKMRKKWKYLLTLGVSTIGTNLIIIFIFFPLASNVQIGYAYGQENQSVVASVDVEIPCTGHAPLIIDEIKKNQGVDVVKFKLPSTFEITFNPEKTSLEEIKLMKIFETYKLNTITN